jgi:hypothetical protein
MARIHRLRQRKRGTRKSKGKEERAHKKRTERQKDGYFHIDGKKYKYLSGSRREVWNGTAFMTSGLLEKSDLIKNKHGRLKSLVKHNQSKKNNNLVKAGWALAKKGSFGAQRTPPRKTQKKGKK